MLNNKVSYSNGEFIINVNMKVISVNMVHNNIPHALSNLPVNINNMLYRDKEFLSYGYRQQSNAIAGIIHEGISSIKKYLDVNFEVVNN